MPPTGKFSDISNATYILYRNHKPIKLHFASSRDVNQTFGDKLSGSTFSHWFILADENDNTTFDLTGNDYLEINNTSNDVITVDAIRLEGDTPFIWQKTQLNDRN